MDQKTKQSEKKSSKSLKEAPPPPLPFAHHLTEEHRYEKKNRNKDPLTVEDTLKMIKEMKELHDKVDHLVDELLEKTGWSPKYLKTYLDNPQNFSNREEWESVQQQRQELMNTIRTPKELEEEAKKRVMGGQQALHDPKLAKERRSKTVGQRRNWLSMR